MSVVSELEVVINGDTSNLQTKLNNADQQIGGFANRAAKKVAGVATSMAKIGAGIGTAVVAFSLKQAIEFESNFANVKKTVDATDTELAELKKTIRDMATDTENPLSALDDAHTTITNIVAMGGQLGVATGDLAKFALVVGAMTVATNLGADQAATFFAQFANVTGLDATQYEDVGNAIVELGNNMATNESNITNFASRLSPLAALDFNAADILGYSAGLASLGISAQLGATNLTKTVQAITEAVATGEDLEGFAEIAGMTADEFKLLHDSDPSAAFDAFIQGLGELDAEDQITQLKDLGITSQEQIGLLLRMALGWGTVSFGLNLANSAFEDSNALMDEAAAKADTTAGKINQFKNKINDLGISLGDKLLPHFNTFLDGLKQIVDGDLGGGLATVGNSIAGLLEDITDWIGLDWDFSTVEEGIDAWVGAFETALRTIVIVTDNIGRAVDAFLLDIKIKLGEAALDFANNPLVQLTPQAGMINQAVEPAQAGLASAQGQRANMDVADQFTEDLNNLLKAGGDIDLASIIFPEDTSGVAEAMSVKGKLVIDDMMAKLVEEQDWENLGVMIPFAEAMDFDMTGLTTMINTKLDEAILAADEEAFNALIPTAAMLDIPLSSLQIQMTESINEAAESQEYTATADVALSINVDVVNQGAVNTAVQSAMSAAGAGSIGMSPAPKIHHMGGTFYHPSGEGLAFLKSGETIRTVAQEKALERSRGGSGGGPTYIVNSYGQNPYGLVAEMNRAQRDMG